MIALAMATAGASIARAQAPTTASDHGYAIAKTKCAACHALTGVDERPVIGAPPFPDIGRRLRDGDLAARLRVVLARGHYAMPPRHLSRSEQRDVAAFILEQADHTPE